MANKPKPEQDGDRIREELQDRIVDREVLARTEHDTAFRGDQREMTGEISQVPQHPGDVSDFTYQRELQLTTSDILDREAQQARDALAKQDAGTYGICEECGRPISAERLAARPEATRCVDCQRALEAARPA